MYKSSLCFFSLLLTSSSALALDVTKCTAKPECEALGYSKNIDVNCHQVIKCPFDLNYKMCLDCNNNSDDDPEPATCPEGMITEAECSNKDGILDPDSITTVGDLVCGICGPKPATCPEGTITDRECYDNGGMLVLDSITTVEDLRCGTCHICPNDSEAISLGQLSVKNNFYVYDKYGTTCPDPTLEFISRAYYRCCPKPCQDGTMYTGALGLSNGYISHKDGTKTKIPEGYLCSYLNQAQTLYDSTVCCRPASSCECPYGPTISSADEITEPGAYCVAGSVTINRYLRGGTYTFWKPSNCSGSLTFGTGGGGATVISHVDLTVNGDATFGNLTLYGDGQFNRPVGGHLTLGNGVYNISSKRGTSDTQVKCDGVHGSTETYLDFRGSSGSSVGDTGFNLNNCAGISCKASGISGFGTIKNGKCSQ